MFGLTRQEQQVIVFIFSLALVGAGTNFLAKRYAPIETLSYFDQDIGKIDLNKADKESLISIPGIGEKIASRIIKYRKQNGNFRSLEDLKNITGVTNYRYEKLKDLFFIE